MLDRGLSPPVSAFSPTYSVGHVTYTILVNYNIFGVPSILYSIATEINYASGEKGPIAIPVAIPALRSPLNP